MKKIIISSLLCSSMVLSSCFGAYQTVYFTEAEAVSRVIDNLGASKSELFIRANDWMVTNFNDASSVIEFSDKESGTLIGKYKLFGTVKSGSYGTTVDTRVYAKIDIRIKDNKVKATILPLGDWQYDSSGFTIYKYNKETAINDINKLIDSLKIKLNTVEDDF
jgi:hypothetical protein